MSKFIELIIKNFSSNTPNIYSYLLYKIVISQVKREYVVKLKLGHIVKVIGKKGKSYLYTMYTNDALYNPGKQHTVFKTVILKGVVFNINE